MRTSPNVAIFEMSQSRSVLAYHGNVMKVREFLKAAVKRWKVSGQLPRIASMSAACPVEPQHGKNLIGCLFLLPQTEVVQV